MPSPTNKWISAVILCGVITMVNGNASRSSLGGTRPAVAVEAHSVTLAEVLFLNGRGRTTLVDARPTTSYQKRHLPNAIRLEHAADLNEEIRQLLRASESIVVYCDSASCGRSLEVAGELRAAGFPQATTYVGGLREWVMAGLETVAQKRPSE